MLTVFIILFFRQRLKAFVSSSSLLVNAFFARAILDLIFFLTGSVLGNKAPKIVQVRFWT